MLAVSLCSGCGGADEAPVPTPMPEEAYVEIMAEFSRIRRRPPQVRTQMERDRVSDSVRMAILEDHGVTAENMLEFAEIVGSDPVRMQRIAERIAALSDSMDAELRQELPAGVADSVTRADSADGPGLEATEEEPAARFAEPRSASRVDSARQVEPVSVSDTGAAPPPTPSDTSADTSAVRNPGESRLLQNPRSKP